MGQTVKSSSSSKTFIIVISVAVVLMLGIVVLTIMDSKDGTTVKGNKQTSSSASAKAVSIDGTLGESALPTYDSSAADPVVGKIVPEIITNDFTGKEHKVTPGTKPYVILFLAHWCPHCQAEVPKLVQLKADDKLNDKVDFIAIATGTDTSRPNYPPSKWLDNEQWPWLALADTENRDLATAFGLDGYPYAIYVNADGTIYKRTSGEVPEDQIIANVNAIAQSAK